MNGPVMEEPNRKIPITAEIICSLILLTGLSLFHGTDRATAAEGTLVREVVHSPALEDNLLGDSSDRQVTVYLPPGYEEHPISCDLSVARIYSY